MKDNGVSWGLIAELLRRVRRRPIERRLKWKRWKQGYRWNMWIQTLSERVLLYLMAKLRGMSEAGYVRWLVRLDFQSLSELERVRLNELWKESFES